MTSLSEVPGAFSESLSGLKKGGGMNPMIGAALIKTGGALFKGLLSGMGKTQEEKRRWDLFMKRMEMIRPKGKYSKGIDPVTAKAIQNMFASRGMEVPEYEETGGKY